MTSLPLGHWKVAVDHGKLLPHARTRALEPWHGHASLWAGQAHLGQAGQAGLADDGQPTSQVQRGPLCRRYTELNFKSFSISKFNLKLIQSSKIHT
jgi:hypothetical protein